MNSFKSFVARLAREEDGAAAAEYAILVALIAVAVSVAVAKFDLGAIFAQVSTKVQSLIP